MYNSYTHTQKVSIMLHFHAVSNLRTSKKFYSSKFIYLVVFQPDLSVKITIFDKLDSSFIRLVSNFDYLTALCIVHKHHSKWGG